MNIHATWKYADMKVLSTTTMMSLLYPCAISEQDLMSTTFMVGFVGVSIHSSYTGQKIKEMFFFFHSIKQRS